MSAALRVELELDDGSFTSRLIHAGESVDQFTRNVGQGITAISKLEKESDGLLSTMRDVTVTLAVAGHAIHNLESVTTGWAGEIIHINAEFERMQALMVSMSTAADPLKEATQTVSALREQARNAPFSLQAMHDSFIRLKSAGLDPMAGSLHALTDAVAAFGGNDQTLNRASLALQEMAGKGVVQMKELRNQLGMAIPNALPMLARAMGVSYEELMSDIHTGTVDAKAAIGALEGVFERTFGGAAERQMQTFNGQLSRLQVNMQNLALHQVGDFANPDGYFKVVRQQLVDLNTFLESSTAEHFGELLGKGLTEAVNVGRGAIDTIVRFKDELGAAGEVLAIGLASKAAWGVIEFGIGQVKTLAREMTLLGVAAQTASTNMAWNNFRVEYQAVVGAGQGGMSRMAGAAANAGEVFALLRTGISTIVPWLAILGPAVAAAAEYFGLFHNKTEEAYESLQRFGARTLEEAKAADAYLKSINDRIAALQALKKVQEDQDKAGPNDDARAFGIDTTVYGEKDQQELDRLLAKQKDVTKERDKFHAEGGENEAKAYVAKQIAAVDEVLRGIQAGYAAQDKIAGDAYETTYNKLLKAHQSTAAAKAKYGEEERARALKLYDDELDALNRQIEAAKTLRDINAAPGDAEKGQRAVDEFTKRYNDIAKSRRAEQARDMVVPMNAKAVDEAKLFEKGQEALARYQDQVKGFTAGIEGLDPKVYELQSALDRGFKFGDTGVEQVRQLIDAMVEAKKEADLLNSIMKSREKLDNDIKGVHESLAERLFKAQTGHLDEVDQLKVKYDNGFYAGFGADKERVKQIIRDLETQKDRTDDVGKAGQAAAEKLASGMDTVAKPAVDRLIETVKTLGSTLLGLAMPNLQMPNMAGLGGLTAPVAGDGKVGAPMFALMEEAIKRGANPATAAGFAAGTSMESGTSLDPNADNGTHHGIPQWDSTRWNSLVGRLGANTMASQTGQMSGIFLELGTNEAGAGRKLLSGTSVADGIGASDAYERPGDAEAARRRPVAMSRAQNLLQQYYATHGLSAINPPVETRGTQALDSADASRKAEIAALEAQKNNIVVPAEQSRALQDMLDKLTSSVGKARLKLDEDAGKNRAQVIEAIRDGKFGSKDEKDARFKPLIDKATELDRVEAENEAAKKKLTAAQTAIKNSQEEQKAQQAKHAELMTAIKDGTLNANGATSEVLRMKGEHAKEQQSVKDQYGENSDQYRTILAQHKAVEEQARNDSISKDAAALNEKTAKLREAVMTQEGAQRAASQREVDRMQKELAEFTGTAEEKKKVEESLTAHIEALRQKQAASTPMAKQMQEWGDLTKNAEQMTANWMNSTSDAIAELVTKGKTDWKKLTQSMASDLVKMGLHYGMSQMFGGMKGGGGKGGMAAGGKGMAGKAAGAATGGKSSMFGAAAGGMGKLGVGHNATGTNNFGGGMTWVGEKGPELVSLPQGSAIAPANSVPAMAQQGPGTAPTTLQQTNVRGGDTHSYSISVAPVLNANGGTQAQNADLSKQMGGHVETAVRRVVADEMHKQMRPGGSLDGSKFTTQR